MNTHTQTYTDKHKWKEITLPSIKISHLLKLVPHHLLLLRHRGGKGGGGEERKNYISFITTMSQYSVLQLHVTLLILLYYHSHHHMCSNIWHVSRGSVQYVKPDTPATCRAQHPASRNTPHSCHKAQPGTVSRPIPHSYTATMLCPGRWPLTNMCSSFWTSVGLAPVASILACCIPGS